MAKPSVKVKISGIPELQDAFKALPDKVRLGAIEAIWLILFLVRNRAIAKIKGGAKSGRIYKRGSITHQSSAPGQSPATDTGTLIRSAETGVEDHNDTVWGAVSFSALYARMLEFGTRIMKARPFFGSTVDSVRSEIVPLFIKTIRARLTK